MGKAQDIGKKWEEKGEELQKYLKKKKEKQKIKEMF
jgi:hypothetical protein